MIRCFNFTISLFRSKQVDCNLLCMCACEITTREIYNMGNQNTQKFSYDVFISYSQQNKNVADAIVADFEQNGIRCWYAPRDLMPGKSWMESVQDAIKNCEIVIPVCTPDPDSSPRVSNELALAASEGRSIEPFRLSRNDISNNLLNAPAGVHWINAVTPSLSMRIIELREKIRPMIADPDDGLAPVNQQSTAPPDDNNTSSVNQNKAVPVVLIFILATALLLMGIR